MPTISTDIHRISQQVPLRLIFESPCRPAQAVTEITQTPLIHVDSGDWRAVAKTLEMLQQRQT